MKHCAAIVVIMVACAAGLARANAEPPLTISCEPPDGFNIGYGTTITERIAADQKKQPEPPPTLRGPTKDGYSRKPTFVIDSNRKNMTVIWAESPDDVEVRKLAKKFNLAPIPPDPATEAIIVSFMSEQISAIEAEPWSIKTYSFFPTFGTVFIGEQLFDVAQKNTRQIATFAHCEFSWTNPNDDPRRKH
jgi:hypothetical protein